MAPVLLCPECRTKHPLGEVNGRVAFPCNGCGRILKVPVAAAAAVPAAAPAAASAGYAASPAADPHATQTFPTLAPENGRAPIAPPVMPAPWTADPPDPLAGAAPRPVADPQTGMSRTAPKGVTWRDVIPGRTVRFVLWIVAVPLAFLIVFSLARSFGMLTTNQITDVALANGWSRFMPIVRLLPFVALATAGFVHGGVFGIAQLRARRHRPRGTGPSAPGAANRQPSPGRAA